MGAPEQTPETQARRLKAYALYLDGVMNGKRRSLRSIAAALGVTLPAVQYWRRKDEWDTRLKRALATEGAAAAAGSQSLQTVARAGLADHLDTLSSIINSATTTDRDRITAIRSYAAIALKLGAGNDPDRGESRVPVFSDELHEVDHDSPGDGVRPVRDPVAQGEPPEGEP